MLKAVSAAQKWHTQTFFLSRFPIPQRKVSNSMQSTVGLRVSSTHVVGPEALSSPQKQRRPSTMRINASPVRCSDTAASQPQEARKPSEFRRGLVVPNNLLSSGITSHVSPLALPKPFS